MKQILNLLKELAEPIANNWSSHPEATIISTVLVGVSCWLWFKKKGTSLAFVGMCGLAAWFVLVACLGTIIDALKKCYERYEEQPIFFVLWTLAIIITWFSVKGVKDQTRIKVRRSLTLLWVVGILFLVPFLNQSFALVKFIKKDKKEGSETTTNVITRTNIVNVFITNVVTITNFSVATIDAVAVSTNTGVLIKP